MSKFTEKAEKALKFAHAAAEDFGHTYIGSEHLLLALASDEYSLSGVILTRSGISADKTEKLIREFCGVGAKTTLDASDMTPKAKHIIEAAYAFTKKYSTKTIGTEHILAALLEEKECVAMKMLNYSDADIIGIKDEVHTLLRAADMRSKKNDKEEKRGTPNLVKYGKNLTAMAEKFDPLIGRNNEIDRVIRVLTRKNKNNPCLLGEAGVGKTAIVEGLASRIVRGDVPFSLYGKEIISVDLTSVVAGAKYRGDFEERITAITDEAAKNDNIILFIDEIHTIVGAGGAEGAIDAANILKPKLARAELQLIGATTFDEYRKYIEKDSALERRFQPVIINEPDIAQTVNILKGVKKRYEEHHGIIINDEELEYAAELAQRYIHDRHMPDKAIDLIDEASAKCALESKNTNENIKIYNEKIKQIIKDKEDAICRLDFDTAAGLRELELVYKAECRRASDESAQNKDVPVLKKEHVCGIVEELIGTKISSSSVVKMTELKDTVLQSIIGQNEAVSALCEAVVRNRICIGREARPLGVFLFTGESGVGKTALACEFAKAMFGDGKFLIRYDMSEFSESASVSKFIGSAPGYVGYDDGKSVLERVRKNPYSVVLLDEFEKACREVKNLFLQIADFGVITDSHGREISFKNTYIILTANTGLEGSSGEIGFSASGNKSGTKNCLRELFGDELLGRMDAVIPFERLKLSDLMKIAEKRLQAFIKGLDEYGIKTEIDEDALAFTAKRGLSRGGVRNIISFIKSEIENKIALKIANGELSEADTVMITLKDERLSLNVKNAVLKP